MTVVIHAEAGIQYAAASRFNRTHSGILDRPLSRTMTPRSVRHIAWFAVNTSLPSPLLQKLRAQHQALDLVGAAFDLVFVVGEVNILDHGAALQHGGRALQLQVLDQRDAVALGEKRAVGLPDLDVHGGVLLRNGEAALPFSPCGRRWRG